MTPSKQLDAYMNETMKDEGDLALHCWACKGNIAYPALASIGRELLAVCATSAPSEHVFFAGRAVVTDEAFYVIIKTHKCRSKKFIIPNSQ